MHSIFAYTMWAPLQVISMIIKCVWPIYYVCEDRENWSNAPPRTYSYYIIYMYNNNNIQYMVRAIYPEHICVVVRDECSVIFSDLCVFRVDDYYDRVYRRGKGSRGIRALEVSAGALWKGFCDQDRQRDICREREREREKDKEKERERESLV